MGLCVSWVGQPFFGIYFSMIDKMYVGNVCDIRISIVLGLQLELVEHCRRLYIQHTQILKSVYVVLVALTSILSWIICSTCQVSTLNDLWQGWSFSSIAKDRRVIPLKCHVCHSIDPLHLLWRAYIYTHHDTRNFWAYIYAHHVQRVKGELMLRGGLIYHISAIRRCPQLVAALEL